MTFNITEERILWTYGTLHVLFGLVTHYHSVWQMRQYNQLISGDMKPVTTMAVICLFIFRIGIGLPWFVVKNIVAPIGSTWYATPEEIAKNW